ncbi:hypothetical protein [Halalkalibacter alkalisediminis]|uniref:Yip1 domain-containing protein n=1 Tax=Halalkalibacter alkalisediminis TaxID=935616 RepID=A0ABV6NJW2_9BACI|nr:hypothetical protein [Halalkalibacter alkalisediminis]
MTFRFELIKSLKDPYSKFYQLKISEGVPFPFRKIALLVGVSLLIALIRLFFALDTANISALITEYSASEFELMKVMIGLGGLADAALSPIVYVFFTSLILWAFLDEVSFRQTLVVSTVSLFILIIGKAALLPFELSLGIPAVASPFALGVAASKLTENDYFIHFFGGISIFWVAAIVIQIYAYSILAMNRKRFIVVLTVSIHFLILLVAVLKTFLGIYLTL